MNFFQVVIEAFRSMGANRLRTVLTMLGIVIGITSVTLLLALGDSMQRFIGKELEALGTNMLYVFPGGSRTDERRLRANAAPSLTYADAQALNSLGSLTGSAPALQGSFKLTAGNETASSMVFGVTPEMFKLRGWKLELGSGFSEADVRAAARMVVIGQKVADQFFYRSDPLGKTIRIENVAFQVVGVLHGEGKQIDGGNLADMVIVPISAARANLVRNPFPDNVHYVATQGKSGQNLLDAIEDIKDVLRDRHRIKVDAPDDFRVENVASFAETAQQDQRRHRAAAGDDRRDLAGGRRHRHHEHHAGVGHRAHPRDRHPHGDRRQAARRAAAVPHRGGGDLPGRRRGRHRDRRRRRRRHHLDRQVRRLHHPFRDRRRLRLFDPGRRVLRILSGPPRLETAAGRLPAL